LVYVEVVAVPVIEPVLEVVLPDDPVVVPELVMLVFNKDPGAPVPMTEYE
jgi:hypothetical protein